MDSIIVWSDPPYDLPFDQYYEYVFNRTGTSEHLTGGNPMLPLSDGGVVDTELRVYGTQNVRIVDGSIFPYQPSAHPMGLTYAVAIRAARILQERQGAGGLTETEQLPDSNSSATATASFVGGTPMVPNATPNPSMPPEMQSTSAAVKPALVGGLWLAMVLTTLACIV